jgi:RHS repeat-associated protein
MHRDRTPGYLAHIRPHDPPARRGRLRFAYTFALFGVLALILLLLPTASREQQGHILYVNNADATCHWQSPCYTTIQAAVDAAVAGDTIRIQAGTYHEQVNISGKNNFTGAAEADRIIIEPDPWAPVGSVILTGAVSQCTNGYGIRLQQSKYITIRGLTITGAGGQAISLMGGNNQNQAIHIERNRIFGNGSSECSGGITIARGNADTLILNNLIYANGRNGITFIDADGGPHSLIENTIFANAWNGVDVARNHTVYLVNNLITGNGTATGSTGGRHGVSREASTSPQPAGIHLLYNLVCGNRLGEINGPALDATDAGNLTPSGSEGSGVGASPGCDLPANVYANLNGPDTLPNTADDDVSLAPSSPAVDRGMDPRTLGLDPAFNPLLEADFATVAIRPKDGNGDGTAFFDLGARELLPPNRPPVANAGQDQTVTAGVLVTLNGSASFDPDGDPLTFQWIQLPGPTVSLATPTAAISTFTAPQVSTQTTLTFQLQVSDGPLSSTAGLIITVLPVGSPTNRPPVLTPIGNQSVAVRSTLTFTVTASDSDGDSLTYAVSPLPLPPNASFIPATQVFTFAPAATQVGTYALTFSVDDGHGGTASETISLTVTAAPALASVTPATGTQGVTLPVTVQGSNTHFAQGTTDLSFGPNISVAGAPEDGFGPATVTDPLTASAQITINPTAALGPRTVTARTGTEAVSRAEAFAVLPPTPPARAGTTVSTLAGTGSSGFADGAGAQAQFASPEGLAFTSGGSLVLADSANHRIRRIAPDGSVTTLAGSGAPGLLDGGPTLAQFNRPQGIAVAADGTLYVADTDNHVLRRVALDGTVSTLAGTGIAGYQDGPGASAQFHAPRSLALRADGMLLIGDEGNARIRLFNPADGTVSTLAGSGLQGFLDGPALQAQFGSLAGFAADANNNVYVADTMNQRIRQLDAAGNVSTLAGDGMFGFRDGPAAQARFADPTGIAVDAAGTLYVADAFNSLIRQITSQGSVSTLAGTGVRGFTDGPGVSATFRTPHTLALDGQGRVGVSDTGNQAVRLVGVAPTITALDPPSAAHDQTIPLTITGTDLGGATAVTFLGAGTPDQEIAATNLQPNAQGTELQATVVLTPVAALGSRVVTVTTPGGTSDATASSGNTFTVLGQLSLVPNFVSLTEGQSGSLTIQLSAPAPTGGLIVTLESASPGIATVPGSVTMPAGATTVPTSVTAVFEGTTNVTASASGYAPGQSTVTVGTPVPSITSFTPSSGKVGTTVVLSGTGFRATPSANTVRFTGQNSTWVVATVSATTSSNLSVTVPTGAVTGPLQVTTSGGTATSTGYFIVLPTQDFSLVVEPTTVTAIAGTSVNLKVSTVTTGDYTGLTTLSTGTLPAGVTGAFTPPNLGPNASGTLTLATSGSTPSGSSIEVRGISTIEGTATTRTGSATLNVQPPGQTVLTGLVRDENDKPVAGVTIKLGGPTPTTLGTTDAAGNFLVNLSIAGAQVFLVDGSTANTPMVSYPTIPVTTTITAGAVNTLGFTVYLHAQPVTQPLPVAPGTPTPLSFANLPNFQVTIPAGVQIVGWDGQVNTQIGVRAVPLDRLAVPPLPPGVQAKTVYMFSFGKVGGGTPTQPIPVTLPNTIGAYPGQKITLWYFNEAPDGTAPNAWQPFGLGTVSSDGKLIVSDPGVGIPRFCCGAMFPQPAPPPQNTTGSERAPEPAPEKCPRCGGPIDLASGLVEVEATDFSIPGRLPLVLSRHYRTLDPTVGPFGVGWRHNYEFFVRAVSTDMALLITPDNLRPRFAKQPDGSFLNTDYIRFRASRLTRNPDNTWTLRFKDGITWTFNSSGWLIAQRDRNGNQITITRDGQNRVSRLTDPAGRSLTFSYSGSDLTVRQVTDPIGRTVQYTYDAEQRLILVTDPLGQVIRYIYDLAGRLESITDPRGNVTERNTYDSAGRVIQQVQADGGTFQISYQVVGGTIVQATEIDPNGNRRVYRFGPGLLLVEIVDSLGQANRTPRAPGTNLIESRTDALGRITRYTYDSNGNVTSTTDPLGIVQTSVYDPTFNQILTSTDALGRVTSYSYDANGNLTGITDPLGHTSTTAYDSFGQPVSITDALGNPTTFEYDSVGNPIASVDPLGHRTERTYGALSRLLTIKDPRGALTQFAYDARDRLVSVTDPRGGRTSLTYDPNGNLLTVTDARGNTTTHEYDARNRVIKRTDPLGRLETYSYDFNGNLRSFTDRKGQVTTHTYDAKNRRIRTDYSDGSFITYTYDPTGNLLAATDSLTGAVTRTYDSLSRFVSEITAQGAITFAHDAADRRTQMQVNGFAPVTYAYDTNGRLTQIQQGTQNATLSYDAASRRSTLTLPNGVTIGYSYNAASRLIGQTYSGPSGLLGDLTYSYDANRNRIGTGGSWARSGVPGPLTSSAYDAANRQLAFGTMNQTFDANGNLLTQTDASGTTTYTWDARNRLIAINGPNVNASFGYDALGRRLAKTVNGITTSFHYDGLDIVREVGAAGETSYLRTFALDETLTRTDVTGTSAYLVDILGSTLALTDSMGAVQTTYTYDPFGTTGITGMADNAFQYTGRENDGTGVYYYRARYYAPLLHRFLSEDPLGLRGGDLNLYAYGFNAPINRLDPLGLKAEVCCRKAKLPGAGKAQHCFIATDRRTDREFTYSYHTNIWLLLTLRRNYPDDEYKYTGADLNCRDCPPKPCMDEESQRDCIEKRGPTYDYIPWIPPAGLTSSTGLWYLAQDCCDGGFPGGMGSTPGAGPIPESMGEPILGP